jgi:Phosphoadenosine phosphosulfate reductase family
MRSRHSAVEFGCRSVLYERAENCHCVPRPGQRFVGRPILSVTGIRRAESAARSKAPVCKPQQRLVRKRAGASGWDWHPILRWSHAEVFAFLRERNQPLHVAYSVYGCSRVSCAFCVLSSGADSAAASRCERNQNVYRQLIALEAESSFSFQPGRCRSAPPLGGCCAPPRPGQGRCAPARGIGIANP